MRKMEGHVYTKRPLCSCLSWPCAILRAEDSLTKNRDVTKIGHRKVGSTGDSWSWYTLIVFVGARDRVETKHDPHLTPTWHWHWHWHWLAIMSLAIMSLCRLWWSSVLLTRVLRSVCLCRICQRYYKSCFYPFLCCESSIASDQLALMASWP